MADWLSATPGMCKPAVAGSGKAGPALPSRLQVNSDDDHISKISARTVPRYMKNTQAGDTSAQLELAVVRDDMTSRRESV